MNKQSYLIDTNILIALEDNHEVDPVYSKFYSLATKHNIKIYIHESVSDDISRDKDSSRRKISVSKTKKYLILDRERFLKKEDLEKIFGPLPKENDVVDATLLHTLKTGAVDFLVTQDQGLHQRAQKYSNCQVPGDCIRVF